MITVFNGLMTPILYMLFFLAAGFVLRRLKVLPDNAAQVLSRLESNLIIPAMILNAFLRSCTLESIRANYPAMLLCAGLEMVLIIISRPLSGLFAKEGWERNLYRYELIYTNTGFFGYALVQAVFGAEVLYHYMLFVLPMTAGCYTIGVSMLTPVGHEAKAQWKRLLNPSMVSIAAGIVLGLLGVGKILPTYITNESATFTYTVTAKIGSTTVYSNVASITLSGTSTGTAHALLGYIPIGSEVTVVEINPGSHYRCATPDATQTAVITADAPAEVSFTNSYSGVMNGGHGIENHFEGDAATGWTWTAKN